MEIDKAKITSLASLAALDLSDDEVAGFEKSLSQYFSAWQEVSQIDTADVAPRVNVVERPQFLREDVVTETNRRDELLSLAPAEQDGLYLVPKVIE